MLPGPSALVRKTPVVRSKRDGKLSKRNWKTRADPRKDGSGHGGLGRGGDGNGVPRMMGNGASTVTAGHKLQPKEGLQDGLSQDHTDRLTDVGESFTRRFRQLFMNYEIGSLRNTQKSKQTNKNLSKRELPAGQNSEEQEKQPYFPRGPEQHTHS